MKKRCILVVLLFLFALSFTIAEEGYNSYVYSVAQPGEFVFDVSNMDVSNIQSSLKTLDSSLEPRLEGNKLHLTVNSFNNLRTIELTNSEIKTTEMYDSYIVEFIQPSLIEEQRDRGLIQETPNVAYLPENVKNIKNLPSFSQQDYIDQLEKQHSNAISDINKKLGNKISGQSGGFFFSILGFFNSITGFNIFDLQDEKDIVVKSQFYKSINAVVLENLSIKDLEKIKKSSYVKAIYPDLKVKANLMDAVPLINGDDVWAIKDGNGLNLTGSNVRIAILDTGVDYTHADLGGCTSEQFLSGTCSKVIGGWDFVNNDNDPIDDQGHGTHCAGIAAGMPAYSSGSGDSSNTNTLAFSTPTTDRIDLTLDMLNNAAQGIYFLGASNGNFTFVGKSATNRLRTSNTTNLVFSKNTDAYFVASYVDDEYFQSYVIRATTFTDDAGIDKTSFEYLGGSSWISLGFVQSGDDIDLGEVHFFINSINYANKTVNITALGKTAFNRIYDKHGNYVFLPLQSYLPTDNYNVSVYNISDSKIADYNFRINYLGEIIISAGSSSSGGSGGGGGSGSGGSGEISPNETRLSGVAPNAKILAYKVLDSSGSGSYSDIMEAIEAAVDPNGDGNISDHVDIISMSLGGMGNPDDALSRAVDNANDAGVVVVVAAGNSGPWSQTIGSPGTARKALTVGATFKKDYNGTYWEAIDPRVDQITPFSSRGPVVWSNGTLNKPDIVAPGAIICSAQYASAWNTSKCFDDKHVQISGTSMATPMVAGAVALLKQKNPESNPEEIKSLLKLTAKNLGYDINTQGAGRIDILNAVNSRIIVSGDLDFGNLKANTVGSRIIKLKNIANSSVSITITPGNAINPEDNSSISVISVNESNFVINTGEEKNILVTANVPLEYMGSYSGVLGIVESNNNYNFLFSFNRYAQLSLSFPGHYPNYYVHDIQMTSFSLDLEGNGMIGDEYTFNVKKGVYVIYAINDFINPSDPLNYPESDEYILVEQINITGYGEYNKIFSLSNGRKFTVPAKSNSGNPLTLYEWHKGVTTYKEKFNRSSFNVNFYDPLIGDRQIYLTNKPDNQLNTDIVLKYYGAP